MKLFSACTLAILGLSFALTRYPDVWAMEVFPILVGFPILLFTSRRFRFTPLVYALLIVHFIVLGVGGIYTYAEVPLGFWMQEQFGFARNNYDKIGHFMQGFVPALLTRELLLRTSPLQRGRWLTFLVIAVCTAISAFYEMLEWAVALLRGESAEAFLGLQGYAWDAQSDMLLATLGAALALTSLSRLQDTLLRKMKNGKLKAPPSTMKPTTSTRIVSIIALLIATCSAAQAQDSANSARRMPAIYTVFVNVLPDGFNFPHIGLVNIAVGSQRTVQAGLANAVQRSLQGAQVGLANVVGGAADGVQAGLANVAARGVHGVQVGLANVSAGNVQGVQAGLANVARRVRGSQIGLITYADTITGVAVALLPIVRRGGYYALELSMSEMAPVSLSFKIGLQKFYTAWTLAYNPHFPHRFAFGFGLGAMLPLGSAWFFNPEATALNFYTDESRTSESLALAFGRRFGRVSLWAAPTLSHTYNLPRDDMFFAIAHHHLNSRNSLALGARIGLRVAIGSSQR